jgi:uncharacterized surface protein with fasciclin (FAS1) repeats
LGSQGPLTFFAPNVTAFAATAADTLNQLLFDDNFFTSARGSWIVDLLLYHIAAGRFIVADLERIAIPISGGPPLLMIVSLP